MVWWHVYLHIHAVTCLRPEIVTLVYVAVARACFVVAYLVLAVCWEGLLAVLLLGTCLLRCCGSCLMLAVLSSFQPPGFGCARGHGNCG